MWIWRNFLPPWRKKSLNVWSMAKGLGDELMALAVLQALAQKSPSCNITFYSRYTKLFGPGAGSLRLVSFSEKEPPSTSLVLRYLPKHSRPLVEQMACELGVRLPEYPVLLPRRTGLDVHREWPLGGKVIVIQTMSSAWTPNKQWPEEHWKGLVTLLPLDMDVVEVGQQSIFTSRPKHPRYRCLVGKTSLIEYAAAIQEASVFVGPVSSGMHLAHAFKVPSVVIVGGYEAGNYPYPLVRQVTATVACSPCWLTTQCPYERKCLVEIDPRLIVSHVLEVVKKLQTHSIAREEDAGR